MKFSAILLIEIVSFAFATFKMFDDCPDFNPSRDIFIENLFDEWFVMMLVMHHEGKSWVGEYKTEVEKFRLTINATKEKNPVKLLANPMAYENVLMIWNSTFQNKSFKLDIAEDVGFWKNDDVNVQVMYADGNLSILTFCDPNMLFSLGLLSTNITVNDDSHENFNFMKDLFSEAFLIIEGVKMFAGANWNFVNLFLFLLVFLNIII